MQKVEGSSPFIRFAKAPANGGFFFAVRARTLAGGGLAAEIVPRRETSR